jgi:lipopolysaccharide transport system ATP-binding protein
MNLPAIEVRGLGKEYTIGSGDAAYRTFREMLQGLVTAPWKGRDRAADSRRIWALRDIDFDVQPGEVVGVIGPNGAGKSTLLKILSRITEPTRGEITIRGRVASLLEVGTGFHPELTGRENIFLNGAILGMSRREIQAKLDEIVAFAELTRFVDTPVKRYSSGMYVRLAFAVAAHLDSDVLLVDEVLAVGDIAFQKRSLNRMGELARSGRTVFCVSHNLASINSLCTRCLLLVKGEIAESGSAMDVTRKYLAQQHSAESAPHEASHRRMGGETARIVRCTLKGPGDPLEPHFLIGEDFELELVVQLADRVNGYLWLTVFDREGNAIWSAHQGDQGVQSHEPGRYRVTCATRGMRLLPGHFTVAVGILDGSRNVLEWIDHCAAFSVVPAFAGGKPFDHRLGMFDQNVEWSSFQRVPE